MAETMPLRETVRYGKFARRETDITEVRWEHQLDDLPDVEATVERIYGMLPWTHRIAFEHEGKEERWLLRGFSPLTQLPD
ncbi:MAG: hypothetical protein WA973_05720 [Mesorhizobium sp.]